MKKIIDLLLVLIVLMMGIGGGFLYREGMGYVDYALRRGNSKDPWGPPQAFEEIYPYPNKDTQNQPKDPLAPTEIRTHQNIDGLHQLAGSRSVLELQGRVPRNICQVCVCRRQKGFVPRQI